MTTTQEEHKNGLALKIDEKLMNNHGPLVREREFGREVTKKKKK